MINHLVRNNIKKLASNLDDKINRHVKSSKVNHEILCKEVISELSTSELETDAFRQDVSKKNQKENCRDKRGSN
jgi:hypothetical protein